MAQILHTHCPVPSKAMLRKSQNFFFITLSTFSDYSTLQSKIQSISIGGSINFQYYFGDKNCDSICKSEHVQKGCKYGLKCKVGSICKSGNCLCTLQMSCNGKSIGGGATFSGNSGNSATFLGNSGNSVTLGGSLENRATFGGNSGNSATLTENLGNSAISTPYLGLSKTSNFYDFF